ncbi:MAG: hypothetical protein ABS36_10900 [Acidobacteria bacterium SCN 69-37]|nr:MAG: hypothetical protein ABS36_10900 [Acidobacteria bacterium SCN 69-37]
MPDAHAGPDTGAAPDPTRCPLCGADNACGLVSGAGTCWCVAVRIPDTVLAQIPPALRDVVCVCPRCAAGRAGTPA